MIAGLMAGPESSSVSTANLSSADTGDVLGELFRQHHHHHHHPPGETAEARLARLLETSTASPRSSEDEALDPTDIALLEAEARVLFARSFSAFSAKWSC